MLLARAVIKMQSENATRDRDRRFEQSFVISFDGGEDIKAQLAMTEYMQVTFAF